MAMLKCGLLMLSGFLILAGEAAAEEHLGTVSFATSCSPAVQADFSRGVSLLHNFWYAEARPQFNRILKADPSCAMAHWGIAMSSFHQIWERPDDKVMAAGAKELKGAKPASQRERAYVAALSRFFRPGHEDYQKRINAYAAAMGKLAARYPDDVDAGAFYALALLATSPASDTSLDANKKAMAVLEPLWRAHPDNPGLVHYITHACDTPTMAAQGLAAARHYGEIAPSGPHSAHMPGHIFSRLGMWQEDIKANQASIAASAEAEAHHLNGWMDQFHSDDFLVYAYLQSGQEAQARTVAANSDKAIAHFSAMPDMAPGEYMQGMYQYYRAKLPIFIALETRNWPDVIAIAYDKSAVPTSQLQIAWSHAIAAGHLGDRAEADSALAKFDELLAELRTTSFAYMAQGSQVTLRRDEMLAWQAFAGKDAAGAAKYMREAADLQDKVGQSEVDIPAREMLADILLETGHPAEALTEYKQALVLSPNRFNGLYGAALAAEASGDKAMAADYYRALLKSAGASQRPEIGKAKAFLG
jgi:tetratricopeptide (TPR) repeat protein